MEVVTDGEESGYLKMYPNSTTPTAVLPSEIDSWAGTGFALNNGYIVTNYHVVEDAKSISVNGIKGDFSIKYSASIVASDKINDIALIKINDNKFNGFGQIPYKLKTVISDVGENVFVLGYPLTTTMGDEIKLTTGVISSKTGFLGDVALYQISAPIQPGNSGGPLFDNKGNIIGIINAKHKGADNVGYAVKSLYLRNLIESVSTTSTIPNSNLVESKPLPEKVKVVDDFIFLIECSNKVSNTVKNTTSHIVDDDALDNTTNKLQAEEYLVSSQQKYEDNNYAGAYSDIIKSVKLYPVPKNHYMKGFLDLYYGENFNDGIKSFNYCIENNYRISDCYQLLLNCYYNTENWEQAIFICNKCIDSDRRDVNALYMRGLCKSNNGDKRGGIIDYEEALKYEGIVEYDYGTIYNNIAYSYIELGEINSAIEPIKNALNINHTTSYIWDTDGELSYKLGKYERCIKSMNNAITIEESDNSYYYRGLANKMLGYLSDAYLDLEKAKELGSKKAEEELKKIDISKINLGDNKKFNQMFKNLEYKNIISDNIKIQAIESTNQYVAIYMMYTNTEYATGGWYAIDVNTYIRSKNTGKKLLLLKAENCTISPEKSPINLNETKQFVLYFESIPKDTEIIDLIEGDKSEWKWYNIQLK